MQKEEISTRQSDYRNTRTCYRSSDGRYYCYEIWDSESNSTVTLQLEVGKDGLTEELTMLLDESDHNEGLNDLYEKRLRDPLFDASVKNFGGNNESVDDVDP